MLRLLAALLLAFPVADGDEETPPPTPELVQSTLAALDAAEEAGEIEPLVQALGEAAGVPDAKVVKRVAKAIRHDDTRVKTAVLEALGELQHPDALASLGRIQKLEKELRKDEGLSTKLLKAITEHEDPAGIELLVEGIDLTPGRKPIEARILGLGRIRTDSSLAALLQLMQRVTGRDGKYMPQFRIALNVLTGVDRGTTVQAWTDWWNENKKEFHVAPEVPALTPELDGIWRRYWGFAPPETRGKRREERGGGQ